MTSSRHRDAVAAPDQPAGDSRRLTLGFIAIEGPIGVGKTTLARRLASGFDARLLLEQADLNPFLAHFYEDRSRYALPTQLHFLLQRAAQMVPHADGASSEPKQSTTPTAPPAVRLSPESGTVVSDFLMDKDRLFAELTLSPGELSLYEQVYHAVQVRSPKPDLVIYLQAPVDLLLCRIRKRGIGHEQGISGDYLKRLSQAYSRFFDGYDVAPLLKVDAATANYASNAGDLQALANKVVAMRAGQRFDPTLPNTARDPRAHRPKASTLS